jgi:rRNA processing protein Krr1/Pno1
MPEEMSKSAKKRAAAKARAANGAAEAEVEPAPAPEPAPKAKAKADAKAKPKADAKPKAEPKAEPKAKAKAEAKAKPEPKPEAKAEPKPAAKAAGKANAKKKAAPAPAPEPPKPKEVENTSHLQVDDGTGGDWEVATALSTKSQRRKDRQTEEAKLTKTEKTTQQFNQAIPGMATAPPTAALVGAAKASQSVTAKVETQKAAEPTKEGEAPKEKLDTMTIKVPEAKMGRVIGPKGANLKLIQEKTGIDRIDTSGEVFTISGKPGTTAAAHAALTELVEKGYMSLAFDNFSEIGCMAHPSTFPDIIGTKGAIIIKLKEELKVEVNIPPVAKGATGPKKYKIGIAGSKEASEKAQKCIEDIIMYGHSEITHPGLVHEELDVPAWAYAFLIGKGGSELRHIQKNWQVKVNIPREHSANTNVVVVGEPRDVARAKEYIEKQISNAESQTSGRDQANKADDFWGEDEHEGWMDQYMYKRK